MIMITKKQLLNNSFLEIPIAHRGLHDNDIPENSMQAFENAINNGFAIEIDIYKLTDGHFAVFHDPNLKRMTGADVAILNQSFEELKNYKLKNEQNIPLLQDVLSLVDGKVPLLIELKPEDGFDKKDLPALFDILDKYNHPDKIAIQSFNPFIIRSVKKLRPDIPAGILASYELKHIKGLKNYVAKSLLLFNFAKADFVAYDIKFLPNKYVAKKKKKGVPVLTWVVKTEENLALAKTVADNIIFENKEILNNDKNN